MFLNIAPNYINRGVLNVSHHRLKYAVEIRRCGFRLPLRPLAVGQFDVVASAHQLLFKLFFPSKKKEIGKERKHKIASAVS